VLRDVVESEDGWTAPVAGFSVISVSFGGQADIVTYGQRADDEKEAPSATITVAGPFRFLDKLGVDHQLDAEGPWDSLVPLLSLRHDHIGSAVADRLGNLVVRFESGALVEVGFTGLYENWQLSGPHGVLIVGLPSGGEPAVWNAVTDR
jgi:hypothetical protein